jgi:hypothetical protein
MQVRGPGKEPSVLPDLDTARDPDQSTDGVVPGRVLHIRLGWLNLGTSDKAYAAALILSAAILGTSVVVAVMAAIVSAMGGQTGWTDSLLAWLGNAFLFTAGIAVGQGVGQNSGKKDLL